VKSASAQPARPSVHVSIDVPDLEAGLRFYEQVFGFVETARPFPTMGILDANAQGGAIENEFRAQGPRPAAFCSDPFGNGFCVIGPRTD
jgi:predicted enzyme related to lactoylglutathione lyase